MNKISKRNLYLIELACAVALLAFIWPRTVRLVHSLAPSVYHTESTKH